MTQYVTQAEFARILGVDPAHVTRLKQADRLVIERGKVNVEASRRLIEETSDPGKEEVRESWQEYRSAKNTENNAQRDSKKTEDAVFPASDAKEIQRIFQKSKAIEKQCQAGLAQIQLDLALGKVIERTEVEAVIEDVFGALRQKLENLPHRLSPELVGKDLDAIRAVQKQEINAILSEYYKDMYSHFPNSETDV